jgi:hypothetical protein
MAVKRSDQAWAFAKGFLSVAFVPTRPVIGVITAPLPWTLDR